MICPNCKNPHATGMYCQSCGFGLMVPEIIAATQPKIPTVQDLEKERTAGYIAGRDAVNAKHAPLIAENIALKQQIQKNNQEAAAAYLKLSEAHDALKSELAKAHQSSANASAATQSGVLPGHGANQQGNVASAAAQEVTKG